MGRSWAGRVSDPGIGTFRKLVFLGWRCVLSGVVLEPDTVLPSICGVLLSKWVFGLCTCLYMHTCAQAPLPLRTALCLPAGPGNLLPAFALNRLRKVDLDLDVCCVLGGGGYEKSLSKKRDSSDRMNPSQCIPTTIPTFIVSMDVAGTERMTQRYSLDPGHGLRVFGKCLQHLAWLLLHLLWWPLDMLSSLSPHSVPRQSRLGWLADLKLQGPYFPLRGGGGGSFEIHQRASLYFMFTFTRSRCWVRCFRLGKVLSWFCKITSGVLALS